MSLPPHRLNSRIEELLAGIRDELPLLIGVAPFGAIYGAVAVQAGLPAGLAQAMSAVVFAGSAQFVTAVLIGRSTPLLVVVMTAVILNLRHVFYSASVAPFTRRLSTTWKLLLGYLLTDEAYAVVITHYLKPENPEHPAPRHWYFLGAGLTLWTGWQISTAAGVFLGLNVPPSWSLDFALPLTFIAILVPSLKDYPEIAAAVSAGVVAVALAWLPYKLGLVAAVVVGIVIGALLSGPGEGTEG